MTLGLMGLPALGVGGTASAKAATLRIGAQIFPFLAEIQKDQDQTLGAIAALGVRQVELLAGLGTPDLMARSLRANGLNAPSVHASASTLYPGVPSIDTDLDQVIAYCRTVGARTLVCSTPWLKEPIGKRTLDEALATFGIDDWRDHARFLVRTAIETRKSGLSLAYHNHTAEFRRIGAATGWDIVMDGTVGHDISIELDCGWAFVGGADPAVLIRKHADRIRLLHIKDIARPGDARSAKTVPVGDGAIDWRKIMSAARSAGVRTAFIEQESSSRGAPIGNLANSLRYLRRLGNQT